MVRVGSACNAITRVDVTPFNYSSRGQRIWEQSAQERGLLAHLGPRARLSLRLGLTDGREIVLRTLVDLPYARGFYYFRYFSPYIVVNVVIVGPVALVSRDDMHMDVLNGPLFIQQGHINIHGWSAPQRPRPASRSTAPRPCRPARCRRPLAAPPRTGRPPPRPSARRTGGRRGAAPRARLRHTLNVHTLDGSTYVRPGATGLRLTKATESRVRKKTSLAWMTTCPNCCGPAMGFVQSKMALIWPGHHNHDVSRPFWRKQETCSPARPPARPKCPYKSTGPRRPTWPTLSWAFASRRARPSLCTTAAKLPGAPT